ncbi:hypothetical protein [Micromonospora musae]
MAAIVEQAAAVAVPPRRLPDSTDLAGPAADRVPSLLPAALAQRC